jgi:hypothetical protein
MRYFTFVQPHDPSTKSLSHEFITKIEYGIEYITMSEEDIRKEYWPYWYGEMQKRYPKDYIDATFSFEDCLEDWVHSHWATEAHTS